jgi:glyceraldehyde-3-phosphate dehydrogenase (NAD(P))
LSPDLSDIESGDFVCIRRANDISQEKGFISSPVVNVHEDESGTHHAKDALDLLQTANDIDFDIFSSALKLNTQYMHTIRFNIVLNGMHRMDDILQRFERNKFIALTEKKDSGRIFSFGRDHGYYGRILNQTIIVEPTLSVKERGNKTHIIGFCFTPQDGNSLLSTVAATLYYFYGDEYEDRMMLFDKYLFQEI